MKFKHCGKGVHFNGQVMITGAENVVVGDNVHIGGGAFIRGEGGLEIGDNTHISRNLVLYTINHDYEGKRLPYDENMVPSPVKIGRNVWIGMNVCITPGTTIGDGAIVQMGTVLYGDVPPLAIVGPAPWHVIEYRNGKHYDELEMVSSYGGPNGLPLGGENEKAYIRSMHHVSVADWHSGTGPGAGNNPAADNPEGRG